MYPLKEEEQKFSSFHSFSLYSHFGFICSSEKYYLEIILIVVLILNINLHEYLG